MANAGAIYRGYESQLIALLWTMTIRLGRAKMVAVTTGLSMLLSVVATAGNLYAFGFLDADYVTLVSLIIALVIPFSIALPVSWFTVTMAISIHELQVETRILATYDAMTGLLNRRAFFEEATVLQQTMAQRNRPWALLLLDLDYFKQINDRHGHAAGDRVLEAFGKVAQAQTATGNLAGRIGGEEFAFFLSEATDEDVLRFAEQLHGAICGINVVTSGNCLQISASMGLVSSMQSETLEKAMNLADKALYRAKQNGRAQSVFYDALAMPIAC